MERKAVELKKEAFGAAEMAVVEAKAVMWEYFRETLKRETMGSTTGQYYAKSGAAGMRISSPNSQLW